MEKLRSAMSYDDEEDDALTESQRRKTCVDCKTLSPATDSSFTLISSRYGWRLWRSVDANGSAIVEWRCPGCWVRFRWRTQPAAKRA